MNPFDLNVLKEAERLWKMGFAVHWLKPKSKMPLESGWTTGERQSWEYLKKTHVSGLNVGTRTGTASKIGPHFLACIDVDVKNPSYKKAAYQKLAEMLGPDVKIPQVITGMGNGSAHFYCVTSAPFKMITVKKVKDAWEICVYSEGRQMVLPPSIHPVTGNGYRWRETLREGSLPLLSFDHLAVKEKDNQVKNKSIAATDVLNDYTESSVELDWLDVSMEIKNLIKTGLWKGKTIGDRSSYLLLAAQGLLSAGCDRDEILSVLSEPSYYLGKAAYDHAQSASRMAACAWLWKYTVKRVMEERDGKLAFMGVAEIEEVPLSEEARATQDAEFQEISWRKQLDKTQEGKTRNTLKNVYLILKNSFGENLFRFNEFAKLDEVWQPTPWGSVVGGEFQERDVQKIKLWMSHNFGFQASDDNIWSALVNIADANAYHPIKDYFEGLPAHDGVARLDFFLERYLKGEAPKKYMRAVSRKTIVAMVARVFEPGIKFDTMLVLEGVQGLRKSTAVSALAGKAWFSDVNLNLKNKDSIADMAGKWVLEQGEMNVMSKHDVAELKQFLSRDTDRMRPSYGRKSQDYPRQSVFIGTTNENIYLKDTSGSRRFWPILVTGDCDIEAIKKDRDQIFAEALAFYKAGEPIWISDQETNHLAQLQQAERETFDELIPVIEEWLEKRNNEADFLSDFDPNKLKMGELWNTSGPFNNASVTGMRMDMAAQKRIAECLKVLGFKSKVVHKKGKTSRLWEKTPECNASLHVIDERGN